MPAIASNDSRLNVVRSAVVSIPTLGEISRQSAARIENHAELDESVDALFARCIDWLSGTS